MKPKPFWLLNHFTIPLFTEISFHSQRTRETKAPRDRHPASVHRFLEKGSETCAPSVTMRSGPGRRPSVDWRHIDMNWNDVKVCLQMSALGLGCVRTRSVKTRCLR